jgi:hypothetical protein
LKSLDLPEPAVGASFVDAVAQIANDLDETVPLFGVYSKHRAADTGLTEMILKSLSDHRKLTAPSSMSVRVTAAPSAARRAATARPIFGC